METPNNWAEFPPELIDYIISLLHSVHRWRIDGRSLSAVNAHWRQQFRLHIHEIHPHRSRVLIPLDVKSLLHFPNITALSPRSFFPSNGEAAFEALIGLRQLSHLNLDAYDVHYGLRTAELSRLTGVTSLHLGKRWLRDVFQGTSLISLSHLPVRKLVIDCHINHLETFLNSFDGLEQLSIAQPIDDISWLRLDRYRALQSLNIQYDGEKPMELTVLSSLVSIRMQLTEDSISVLSHLERLRNVGLFVNQNTHHLLSQSSFWNALQPMTSLLLSCPYGFPEFEPTASLNLSHLELFKCTISRGSFDGLENLTSLSLWCCHITETKDILMRLVHLRRLSLRNLILDQNTAYRLLLCGNWVQHLQVLNVDKCLIDWLSMSQWRMPNLESLCVHGWLGPNIRRDFFDRCVQQLPSLRHLGISGEGGIEAIWASMKMELLLKLESLCIDVQYPNADTRPAFRQRLSQGPASHLKIEFEFAAYLREVMKTASLPSI